VRRTSSRRRNAYGLVRGILRAPKQSSNAKGKTLSGSMLNTCLKMTMPAWGIQADSASPYYLLVLLSESR
jgi:hypothetical protein